MSIPKPEIIKPFTQSLIAGELTRVAHILLKEGQAQGNVIADLVTDHGMTVATATDLVVRLIQQDPIKDTVRTGVRFDLPDVGDIITFAGEQLWLPLDKPDNEPLEREAGDEVMITRCVPSAPNVCYIEAEFGGVTYGSDLQLDDGSISGIVKIVDVGIGGRPSDKAVARRDQRTRQAALIGEIEEAFFNSHIYEGWITREVDSPQEQVIVFTALEKLMLMKEALEFQGLNVEDVTDQDLVESPDPELTGVIRVVAFKRSFVPDFRDVNIDGDSLDYDDRLDENSEAVNDALMLAPGAPGMVDQAQGEALSLTEQSPDFGQNDNVIEDSDRDKVLDTATGKRAQDYLSDQLTRIMTDVGIPPLEADAGEGIVVLIYDNEEDAQQAGNYLYEVPDFIDVVVEPDVENPSLWAASAEVVAKKRSYTERQINRSKPFERRGGSWWLVTAKEGDTVKQYVVQSRDSKGIKIKQASIEVISGPFANMQGAIDKSIDGQPTIMVSRIKQSDKITVEDLANDVNKLVEDFDYFYAYALLKDSKALWDDPAHEAFLSEDAKIILYDVQESLESSGMKKRTENPEQSDYWTQNTETVGPVRGEDEEEETELNSYGVVVD